MNATKTARTLGWVSLGLGAAEIIAPRMFTRTFGTNNRAGLVRTLYGMREVAAGAGILSAVSSRRNPAPFLWARVAGDVFDLVSLAKAMPGNVGRRKRNIALGMAAVAGIAALDLASARRLTPA